jgi:hypothetical protein
VFWITVVVLMAVGWWNTFLMTYRKSQKIADWKNRTHALGELLYKEGWHITWEPGKVRATQEGREISTKTYCDPPPDHPLDSDE